MFRLTSNEIVNKYWQFRSEFNENNILPFVIRGNLQWQSESGQKITNNTRSIWLKSNFHDLVGKVLSDYPIEYHTQYNLNLYEIWGGVNFECNLDDVKETREIIENCINDISLLTDLISLYSLK